MEDEIVTTIFFRIGSIFAAIILFCFFFWWKSKKRKGIGEKDKNLKTMADNIDYKKITEEAVEEVSK